MTGTTLAFLAATAATAADPPQPPAPPVSPATTDFHIPAQPLATALEIFARQTGIQLLYDSSLDPATRSPEVDGRLTSADALSRLLSGTGLQARAVGSDAIILIHARPDRSAPDPTDQVMTSASKPTRTITMTLDSVHVDVPRRAPRIPYNYYSALMEAEIRAALLRDRHTHPHRYVIRLMLWLSPSGEIVQSHVLSSTGDTKLDDLIDNFLRGFKMSRPPPDDMPQPIQLRIFTG